MTHNNIDMPVKVIGHFHKTIVDSMNEPVNLYTIADAVNDHHRACELKVKDDKFFSACNGKQTTYSTEFKYCRYCGGVIVRI